MPQLTVSLQSTPEPERNDLTALPAHEAEHDFWCGLCGLRQPGFLSADAAEEAANAHFQSHLELTNDGRVFIMATPVTGTPLRFRVRCHKTRYVSPWTADEAAARASLEAYRTAAAAHYGAFLDVEAA